MTNETKAVPYRDMDWRDLEELMEEGYATEYPIDLDLRWSQIKTHWKPDEGLKDRLDANTERRRNRDSGSGAGYGGALEADGWIMGEY